MCIPCTGFLYSMNCKVKLFKTLIPSVTDCKVICRVGNSLFFMPLGTEGLAAAYPSGAHYITPL